MKRTVTRLITILILGSPVMALSQNTAPIWSSYYSGAGDNSDRFNKIISDGTGNFIAVGYTIKKDNYRDFLTVKFNTNGDTLWWRTKNGSGNFDDEAVSAAVDASGNVYVCGYSDGGEKNNDIYLLKYDINGVKLWDTTWNSVNYLDDVPVAMELDGSGNIFIGGSTEPDTVSGSSNYITLRFNPTGGLDWQQEFSRAAVTSGKDELTGLVVDAAGDVYVTGRSSNGADDDFVTIKYNGASGVQSWLAVYNSGNGDDRGAAIAKDNGGNIIVTGRSDNGSNDDFRTIKYNAAGLLQWSKFYNAPANQNDRALALTVDASDNVYVTGQSDADNSATTNYDYALVKYNSAGVQQFAKITGSNVQQYDIPSAIAVSASGNIYITGKSDQDVTTNTDNDFMTVMYSPAGSLVWTAIQPGTRTGGSDIASSLLIQSDTVYVAGGITNNLTQKDASVIKYTVTGSVALKTDYNGEGDFNESAKAIIVDTNDNTYTCGYSFQEENNRDAVILKTDPAGNILCTYMFRGAKGDDDEFNDIALASNGSIYAAGYTKISGYKSDFLLVKWNPATCDTVWTRTYDYITQSDRAEALTLDAAGNIYVTGRSDGNVQDSIEDNDFVTMKYDQNGTMLWLQRYGGPANVKDEPAKISLDGNGDVIVSGRTENVHDDDFIVIKYNGATGTPAWPSPSVYGGPFANDDRVNDMTIDSQNNIFLAGFTQTSSGSTAPEDPVIVKYDAGGNFTGFYSYQSTGQNKDEAMAIGHDISDNIFVAFRTDVNPSALMSDYNFLTMKFDNGLNPLWATPPQYASPINKDDKPVDLLVTPDGEVFVTGTTENSISAGLVNQNWLTLLYDANGNQIFMGNFDGPNATDDAPNAMVLRGNSLWVCGYVEGTTYNQKEMADIRYDVPVGINSISDKVSSSVYPDPFRGTATIVVNGNSGSEMTLRIFDITGTQISSKIFYGNSTVVNGEKISAGAYQYSVASGNQIISRGRFIIN